MTTADAKALVRNALYREIERQTGNDWPIETGGSLYLIDAELDLNALAQAALEASHSMTEARDGCEFCLGVKGGVPGNENVIDGRVVCDYCHALLTAMQAARPIDQQEATCNGCWHLGEACGHCSVCTPTGVTRPSYIGPPCPTCGAAHPFDNVFCSDGFHAPPDATSQDDDAEIARIGREHLQAGNIDDALTAFNRIANRGGKGRG